MFVNINKQHSDTSIPIAVKMNLVEKSNAIRASKKAFENVQNSNYITTIEYDGYEVYELHNSKNEMIAENSITGYITIHRSDGQTIIFEGDDYYYGRTASEMELLSAALQFVELGEAEMYKVSELDQSKGFSQYYIDIQGLDKVEEMIALIDEDMAPKLIDQIKQSMIDSGLSEDNTERVNFRYYYAILDSLNWIEAAANYVYLGDYDPLSLTWNDMVLRWQFYGLGDEIMDWELEQDFYTMDFDNFLNFTDEDFAILDSILSRQIDIVTDTVDAYTKYKVEEAKQLN